MSHVVESFEHKGYTVEIIVDEEGYASDPRDSDGNLFLFLGLPHRSYNIGDEQFNPEDISDTCKHCNGTGEEPGTEPEQDADSAFTVRGADCTVCQGDGNVNPCVDPDTGRLTIDRTVEFLMADTPSPYVVPVGMIDHSGVSYYLGGGPHWSDSAGWDSGTCGFMVLLPAKVKEHMGEDFAVTEEWAREAAEAEVKEYSSWASGDVYGVVVTDLNGDTIESVWGMIGYDYAVESAREIAEALPEPPAKLHTLRLTDAALDTIETVLAMHEHTVDSSMDYAGVLATVREQRGEDE